MKIKVKKKFYDIKKHGITQSLISKFLECRQAARYYLQGYESIYNRLPLTEGSIGHEVLQHAYEDIKTGKLKTIPSKQQVIKYTKRVEKQWLKENSRKDPRALEHVEYSLTTMEATLPAYFDFWRKDLKQIKWLGLEESFALPYVLPDGRKTILRGKKDGEFLKKGLWLFETKFKSQISESNLIDTLSFDTQVLLYLRALKHIHKRTPEGVLYNVIRRTCLQRRKAESLAQFAKRLKDDIENRPDFYFMRFEIATDDFDLEKFDIELEGIIKDFYDWIEGKVPHYKNTYNCVGKYGRCDFLPCCGMNDFSALKKRKILFKELEDF